MTQAIHNTRSVNKIPSNANFHNNLFAERSQAFRLAIANARPVMMDDYSRPSKTRIAHQIWKQSVSVIGSIADNYFLERGITYDPEAMGMIKFNPSVLHEPSDEKFPAIIAPVHDRHGVFVGIHKTYLSRNGDGRAPVAGNSCRMLGDCHAAHIRLSTSSSRRLVLTESLETALAIRQACPGLQVWAAMSPFNMRSPVPSAIREIILCPDANSQNMMANAGLVKAAMREHLGRGLSVSLAPCLPGKNYSEIL